MWCVPFLSRFYGFSLPQEPRTGKGDVVVTCVPVKEWKCPKFALNPCEPLPAWDIPRFYELKFKISFATEIQGITWLCE